MKRKYTETKDDFNSFFRPSLRQRVLAAPERSRPSGQEPAVTHDPEISATTSTAVIESQAEIETTANATLSGDVPALKTPAPEPSPRPEHTSSVAEADTQLPLELSTCEITGSVDTQIAKSTQGVTELRTQRQEVEEEKLMTRHEKAITTGQALLSLRAFWRIAYTLRLSQSGLPRKQTSSITTATPSPL